MGHLPPFSGDYTDEFGPIDADVYATASAIWPQAEAFARRVFYDPDAAQTLLIKTAAYITKKRSVAAIVIENLPAYLLISFERQILKEVKRIRLGEELCRNAIDLEGPAELDLERSILIEEVVGRMDEWSFKVFQLSTLGYTYEEIARDLGIQSNAVRSRFSKQLRKIRAELNQRLSKTD